MKVLHILYSGLGGHGNVFFSLADADIEHEFQYEALFFGIETIRQQYIQKAAVRSIPWYFVMKKPGLDLQAYRKIITFIRKSSPDIIFLHTSAYIFPAKYAALFSRRKMRIIVRETQPNHLKTRAEWAGLAFSLKAADQVVFLSNEYRDAVKRKFPVLFSANRTKVIPNGIDLDIFKPAPHLVTGIVKIGMQSRLSVTKDHPTLIRSFHQLLNRLPGKPELQLWIAGDGECRPELEKLVNDLALSGKVFFTGLLEEEALPGFINSLDVYVHATTGETMSTAIMQVMACGVPVIASDVLGVSNMIQNGQNGLLVPVKEPEKLAEAICFVLENPVVAKEITGKAYQYAISHFSNRRMFEQYRAVFLKV